MSPTFRREVTSRGRKYLETSGRREQILRMAYFHWIDGGRRDGTADEDWFWAEREWARRRVAADLNPGRPSGVSRAV